MEKHTTNGFHNNSSGVRKFEEIQIPVPWGQVSGKWWGPKYKQPIIALHGWQDNAGTWDGVCQLLPENIAVLCLDLPGHGLSSHYPPGMQYYVFWDGIALIRRIVKHFRWSNIILMGHSLGGALSFMYAASFPDDVDKYISMDIAGPPPKNTQKIVDATGFCIDQLLKYETLTEDNMPCYSYNEMLDIVIDAYKGSVTRPSCEILMKRGMMPTEHKKGYHFRRDPRLKVSMLAMFSIEFILEYASRIKCKVLNIRADPGYIWDSPEHYDAVLDKIAESASLVERHTVKGTHHVHLNEPEKVLDIIENFLSLK